MNLNINLYSKTSLFLAALFIGTSALAQEIPQFETVVEDVMFNTSSRVVIDEKAIKESRAPDVTNLLSTQANIVFDSGNSFKSSSLFIRGGGASQILIIVDGVPFYDSSSSARTFNLNSLDIKTVKRIEIIKGAQTVLYGGQALAGVIKIDTLPVETNTQSMVRLRAGNREFGDITLSHTQRIDEQNAVYGRVVGTQRRLQSMVLDDTNVFPAHNIQGDMAYIHRGENIDAHVKASHLYDWQNTPSFSPTNSFNEDDHTTSRTTAVSTVVTAKNSPLKPRLSLGYQNSERHFLTELPPFAPIDPDFADQKYIANLYSARADVQLLDTSRFKITSGLSFLYEDMIERDLGVENARDHQTQSGLFIKADWQFASKWELTVGGRYEAFDGDRSFGSYQAGLSFNKITRIEVASGYRFPSLFQRYSPHYGNPDLREEKGLQFQAIQDININDNHRLSITAFHTEYDDLIEAVTVSAPPGPLIVVNRNVSKATTQGLELAYSWTLDSAQLLMTAGYQEPYNRTERAWLNRRPLTNGSIKWLDQIGRHGYSLETIMIGTREDTNRTGAAMKLPGYAIFNASYSFDVSDRFSTYVRINNLADYRYLEATNSYSQGINGHIGLDYLF